MKKAVSFHLSLREREDQKEIVTPEQSEVPSWEKANEMLAWWDNLALPPGVERYVVYNIKFEDGFNHMGMYRLDGTKPDLANNVRVYCDEMIRKGREHETQVLSELEVEIAKECEQLLKEYALGEA